MQLVKIIVNNIGQGTVTVRSRYGHSRSRYGHSTITVGHSRSRYGHSTITVGHSRSRYGHIRPRHGHSRSRYGDSTVTVRSQYGHVQLMVSSRPAGRTITDKSRSVTSFFCCMYVHQLIPRLARHMSLNLLMERAFER